MLKYTQETPSGGPAESTLACHSFSTAAEPLRWITPNYISSIISNDWFEDQ